MKDIKTRTDISLLVDAFYTKVLTDEKIGPVFTNVAEINLEKHLPTMYDFWETTLFGKVKYKGNPMLTHILLHKKSALTPAHFERWLSLWKETVSELFEGEIATKAIQRSEQIGALMQYKIGKLE